MLTILNYGGKLLVVWISYLELYNTKRKRKIWCSKFLSEKRQGGEVWGKLEWDNTHVLSVPKSYEFLSCVVIAI